MNNTINNEAFQYYLGKKEGELVVFNRFFYSCGVQYLLNVLRHLLKKIALACGSNIDIK
jgi:hypothetical protein